MQKDRGQSAGRKDKTHSNGLHRLAGQKEPMGELCNDAVKYCRCMSNVFIIANGTESRDFYITNDEFGISREKDAASIDELMLSE